MGAKRVSIFINEADEWHGRRRPLHIELLRALANQGVAGAAVVRGVAGYTGSTGICTTSLVDSGGLYFQSSSWLTTANTSSILPEIEAMVGNRLISNPRTCRYATAARSQHD